MTHQISHIAKTVSIALAVLVLLASPVAFSPVTAHAADLPDDSDWTTTGYTDYSAPSYSDNSTDWTTTGYTDNTAPVYSDNSTDWTTTGYTDYTQPTYTNNSTDWTTTGYTDYTQPTYSTGGFYNYNSSNTSSFYNYNNNYNYNNGGGCSSNCNPQPQPKPAPTCSIVVNPTSLTQGQSATLTWTSTNATAGSITNIGSVSNGNGSTTVTPNQSMTYVGTFTGPGGSVTCTGSVGVVPPTPQYCPVGYTGTYPNCIQIPVYQAPSCTISLSQNYMTYGQNGQYNYNQPVTLYWTSNNANYGWINQSLGNVNTSGSRVVYPNQTTTYTGTFTGQNGQTVTCSATISINNYVAPIVYNTPNTPYVTLSAVPYTGLDLGPVGNFLYWGFLIVWCLIAAYLIAVKRVQNKVYASLKTVLFGKKTTHVAAVAHTAPAHTVPVVVHAPVSAQTDAVDPFILSQVHRVQA